MHDSVRCIRSDSAHRGPILRIGSLASCEGADAALSELLRLAKVIPPILLMKATVAGNIVQQNAV